MMLALASQHINRSLESVCLKRLAKPNDQGRPGMATKSPPKVLGGDDNDTHQDGQEYHAAHPR